VVATNAHVVEGATRLKVLYQKKQHEASLLYLDWDRDVCTLKVSGLKVPAVVLGNSSHLKVGSRVYAIGAPKGLILTMSEGIISSLRPVDGGQYLQITAPISPGSSGGGLFDEKGRLIGLTTAYIADGQQLNFAVPVEWIRELPKRHQKFFIKGMVPYTYRINKAESLASKGDWGGLLDYSIQWIKEMPQDALALYFMGIAYSSMGLIDKAIEAYQQALHINPEYPEIWYNLGNMYLRSGDNAKAMQAFDQAIRIYPDYAKAYCSRGLTYSNLGKYNRSIYDYNKAIELNPEYAKAYYNRGCDYSRAIEINPEFQLAYYNLGNDYRKIGDYNKSVLNYNKAIELNPADASAHYNRGITFSEIGDNNQMINDYKIAARLGHKKAQDELRRQGIVW
jgi:tetratricopeptide (TPR) repeat protein